MTAETDPIRVFPKDGKWLVDYGSYAHGYHETRREDGDGNPRRKN